MASSDELTETDFDIVEDESRGVLTLPVVQLACDKPGTGFPGVAGVLSAVENPEKQFLKTLYGPVVVTHGLAVFDCCIIVLYYLLGVPRVSHSGLLKFLKTGKGEPSVRRMFPQTEFRPMLSAMLDDIKSTSLTKSLLSMFTDLADSSIKKLGKRVVVWSSDQAKCKIPENFHLLLVVQEANGLLSISPSILDLGGLVRFTVYLRISTKKKKYACSESTIDDMPDLEPAVDLASEVASANILRSSIENQIRCAASLAAIEHRDEMLRQKAIRARKEKRLLAQVEEETFEIQ